MLKNKRVMVFGRSEPPCAFCDNLKTLLEKEGVVHEYKDIAEEDNFIAFSKHRLRTVPAVFVDDEFVGGFSEVKDLFKGV